MAKVQNEKQRIKRELIGQPIMLAGVTVTPVARLDGVLVKGPQTAGSFQAGFVRLVPVRAVVQGADGEERTVEIRDVVGGIRRNMGIAGALIAAAALAVTVIRKLK